MCSQYSKRFVESVIDSHTMIGSICCTRNCEETAERIECIMGTLDFVNMFNLKGIYLPITFSFIGIFLLIERTLKFFGQESKYK